MGEEWNDHQGVNATQHGVYVPSEVKERPDRMDGPWAPRKRGNSASRPVELRETWLECRSGRENYVRVAQTSEDGADVRWHVNGAR